MAFFRRLWRYLRSKRDEVRQLQQRDLLAASVIAEIQARKLSESAEAIAVDKLLPFHAIDRENALEKLKEREEILERRAKELRRLGVVSKSWMMEHFPSITHFKAVPYGDAYVVYDGNGRLLAIRNVLGTRMKVEVDVIRAPRDIEAKIRRVRVLNGLED